MKRQTFRSAVFFLLSATIAQAHTGKIFMMPRSASVNMPMEYVSFKQFIDSNKADFGAYVQSTGLYGESTRAR